MESAKDAQDWYKFGHALGDINRVLLLGNLTFQLPKSVAGDSTTGFLVGFFKTYDVVNGTQCLSNSSFAAALEQSFHDA